MKNLIVLLVLLAFGITAKTQAPAAPKDTQSVHTKTLQTTTPAERKVPANEYVKMSEGKIWYFKDGQKTELDKEMTLGETKVKPDGTVLKKDGTSVKLKEGNVVNKNGTVIDMAALKQKAMEQKKAETQPENK